MSAEAIANVVADVTSPGGIKLADMDPGQVELLRSQFRRGFEMAYSDDDRAPWLAAPVVDATSLYRTIQPSDRLIDLYGDHQCIAPPWERAWIGFENRFGNVILTQMWSIEYDTAAAAWETDNPVEWDRVHCLVWIGGRSVNTGRTIPATGPMFIEQYAVYPDGEPADLHWVQIDPRWVEENSQSHLRVNLGVLNFMSCRNIELAVPQRPRPERRRLERTGVRVSEIHVFPAGRSTAGGGRPLDPGGTALHSVRGHFASYGPEYGRGKLFGKYEGRFFRPMHARGSKEHGQVEQSYTLHPDEERAS
jgi:hypothetical protein